ncbi:glutathione S-transferase [Flagellatimonas centrodinii]|uniref:glutathione S-transferase n=1 Tax=Flagellatimonas centrodinii TaxID=2806210 RepID=UPI001FEE16E9|nr:glutathione S-transferase [Flagellatimonas centrodinii]ULQ46892.1 glutathione S-transferase [Flagellatimonas centrodinii]
MIVVHHLEHSRSQRVLWLLEELGVDYEVKRYARHPKTMLAPPELKAVHPLGKSPVITDGDATVAETGAIIEYLIDAHDSAGALRPAAGSAAFADYRYWLHYGEGSLMPLLVMKLIFGSIPPKTPALIRPIAKAIVGTVGKQFLDPNLGTHLGFIENTLQGRQWFAGDQLSGADILMSFPLEAAGTRAGGSYPAIRAYVERLQSRPAYRKALERGGPYRLLG